MTHPEDDHEDAPDILPFEGHFTDLGAARKTRPKWVIDQVMTTGLTIVIGPPKDSYKTTLVMAFALLIARHRHAVLPPEWTPKIQGPVLIWEAEADEGELKEMCEDGMGVKVPADESILVAKDPESYRLDEPGASDQLISWCEERDVAAAILDPLINFHELDEKDAVAMVRTLRPLRKWAKNNDTAFILIHHTRKIEEGRVYTAQDARGTSAIFGLCDNIIVITPGKEAYEIMISRKGKKGKAFEKVFFLNIWDRAGKHSHVSLPPFEKMILRAIARGGTATGTTMAGVAMLVNVIPSADLASRLVKLVRLGALKMDKQRPPSFHITPLGKEQIK